MPNIRLILEDDLGNQTERTFALTGEQDTLDGIDEAVEQFKKVALPHLEQQLLSQAQERALTQEKKNSA